MQLLQKFSCYFPHYTTCVLRLLYSNLVRLREIAKQTPQRHNRKNFSIRETKVGFRIKITFMVERCRSKEGRVTPHYQPISNTLLPFTSLQKCVRPFHPRVWRASQKSKNLHISQQICATIAQLFQSIILYLQVPVLRPGVCHSVPSAATGSTLGSRCHHVRLPRLLCCGSHSQSLGFVLTLLTTYCIE